ncbi:MAG TPA: 30S ribosomal protein S1 [Terriglobales bacterium]|nr:30S ribosomal protein S1 [Terriglobales bacterium]
MSDLPSSEQNTDEVSFGDLLSQFERAHKPEANKQLQGTVIAVSADTVFLDIGYKTEGVLPLSIFQNAAQEVKPGDRFLVSVKGRNEEGYYELSRSRVERPADWPALERAFNEKSTILGTVSAVVKGGLTVDVGVRAFMAASRSGARDASEMEKLVGQEIRCRITKLDITEEDVVVDRRALAEEEANAARERRYSEISEGDVLRGTVRSLADYGAFIDLGGVDALLHVGEISWSRVEKPSEALSVGQEIEVKVLKVGEEGGKRRIAVSMKQLQPHPWDSVAGRYNVGERVRGRVSRVTDFGAFVELEPGIEGLIHISELSWTRKVKRVTDVVKTGDTVDAIILAVNVAERRISLGLKQALGDPWADISKKFPAGSAIEGPIISITNFGAFVQITEGVEGMIHVSEISTEKRIAHPRDVLKVGQVVQAQILAIDTEKRNIRLSMKQLVPTGLDEYLAEHKPGDIVSGRIMDVSGSNARVELGEGIQAKCKISSISESSLQEQKTAKADVSSLSSMLQARWKGETQSENKKTEPAAAGQVRSFRITRLDPDNKKIELELK